MRRLQRSRRAKILARSLPMANISGKQAVSAGTTDAGSPGIFGLTVPGG